MGMGPFRRIYSVVVQGNDLLVVLRSVRDDWEEDRMTSEDLIDVSKIFFTDQIGTHYVGCWKFHRKCAVHRMITEINVLNKLLKKGVEE